MSEIKDGGPAFPVIGAPGAAQDYPGMTLRDKFADSVLCGIYSSGEAMANMAKVAKQFGLDPAEAVAKTCYQQADAMLRAREVNHG